MQSRHLTVPLMRISHTFHHMYRLLIIILCSSRNIFFLLFVLQSPLLQEIFQCFSKIYPVFVSVIGINFSIVIYPKCVKNPQLSTEDDDVSSHHCYTHGWLYPLSDVELPFKRSSRVYRSNLTIPSQRLTAKFQVLSSTNNLSNKSINFQQNCVKISLKSVKIWRYLPPR